MTETVSVYEAKTHLSKLLARVEAGEDFVISRNGKPIATIGPAPKRRPIDALGIWIGKVEVSDDFAEFTEEDEQDWYGGENFPAAAE